MRARFTGFLWLLALSCGDDGTGAPAEDGSVRPDAASDGAAADGAAPDQSGDVGAAVATCPAFRSGASLGEIGHDDLTELSGLAASRAHEGLLYGHNDSGDGPRFFAFDADGTPRATYRLEGAAAEDWEDMAIGPGPDGSDWLYFGDHGDNAARSGVGGRQNVTIYRVAEPSELPVLPTEQVLGTWERIVLTYPEAPRDAESLFLDPDTGDLFLITKDDDGMSTVFRVVSPLPVDTPTDMEPVARIAFGTETIPGSVHATGADIAPDGSFLAVRTYSGLFLWRREAGEPVGSVLGGPPDATLATLFEIQGEAVAIAPGSAGYYTASEGATPPVHYFEAVPSCASP